jgi:Fic family protein
MRKYVYQHREWPNLFWNEAALSALLGEVRLKQGLLLGKLGAIGFILRNRTSVETLTREITDSFEIEGEHLDESAVRSSVARRLGIDNAGVDTSMRGAHFVDGVVEMTLDAAQKHDERLSEERLFGWHAALFPSGYSGLKKIMVGEYRREEMKIVSGPVGKEKVRYVAPSPADVPDEMALFLRWLNSAQAVDSVLMSGIAHFRFIMIHPFDDGNGRLARALSELFLARSDMSSDRYYSLSSRLLVERKDYYAALEKGQYSSGDITDWLSWYLGCLARAIDDSSSQVDLAVGKADFWDAHRSLEFNQRQHKLLSLLLDGFVGKLTTDKWAKIAKTSHDTALRDIKDMIAKGILEQEASGGRSTSYRLIRPRRHSRL